MASLSTEEFPYTLGYVKELLNLDEPTLLSYAETLSLTIRTDEQTGSVIFNHRDVEMLRKALELQAHGGDLSMFVPQRRSQGAPDSVPATIAPLPLSSASQPVSFSNGNTSLASPPSLTASRGEGGGGATPVLAGKENLAVIVEAVSQAKEGILKDLSRLLDDKLAGLDEVVVELIRCKSENDSLKAKLKTALDESESLREELSRFKPVQFGFYRKLG